MHLEGLAVGLVALEKLGLDIWVASGSNQGRYPVLSRDNIVDFGARLHESRPTDHRRHAVAAFPVRVLFAAKWRGAAVRPAEGFGAVVGCVDHYGVVCDTQIIELLQKLSDLAIVLHHAVGIDAKASLFLRLRLEAGPDMHAARIEPGEEGLLLLVGAIDEVQRGVEKLLIHRLHALLVERAGILAILLTPFAEARVLPGCFSGGGNAPHHAARTEFESELGVLGI